ncbi:hypothetical protein AB0L70_25085 [Kribbella sp. NPDC051952]|uniref:hypothetical protein n=1 Tax=Kribbella sp. NPDC051952 TaxID=3154851 RepID=UPI0034462C6A
MLGKVAVLGLIQNYAVGWVLHYVYLPDHETTTHTGHHGAQGLSPFAHFLRDSTLALPVSIGVLLLVAVAASRLGLRDGVPERIAFAVGAAVVAAVFSAPEVLAHGWLFDEQVTGDLTSHLTGVALVTLRYTFALVLVAAVLFGVPWRARTLGETR